MRIVLVTGATTGIGLETAIAFAKRGDRVYAGARNPAKADLLRAAAGEGLPIAVIELDVDKDESVERAVAQVAGEAGRIDVLVNNAGIGAGGPIELVPLALSKAVFETNFFGAIRVTKAVLPHMRRQGAGTIVNVTSVVGRVALAGHAHYTASKWALEAASEILAAEVRPHGIRVAIVEPGAIQTPIWGKADGEFPADGPYAMAVRRLWRLFESQLDQPTMPDEVAEAIVRAVETDEPRLRYPVGADARISVPARARLSDEEWVALQAEPDDATFVARAKEVFGIDLYNGPSARARTRGLKP